MGKTVAIIQSNYIPWKGYFDLIAGVDELILYDDVQFTRSDWRNRNRIKTPQGPQWLTIPVCIKGRLGQKIRETAVREPNWGRSHWQSLMHNYARAPHFRKYAPVFEPLYAASEERMLSRINYRFLVAVCDILGIPAKLSWSMDYDLTEGKTERLVSLCRQATAKEYLSGPAAREYLDESLFQAAGIHVRYMDYSRYPEYRQLFPPFEHAVSILDLIFNEGPEAPKYMMFGSRVPLGDTASKAA
ncbi:MAG: WbqC family protein [Capsulimonadaceae bacterium]